MLLQCTFGVRPGNSLVQHWNDLLGPLILVGMLYTGMVAPTTISAYNNAWYASYGLQVSADSRTTIICI